MWRTIKVFIFDFDGVIVESNHIKTAAFHHVFSRFPEHYEEMMAFHYSQISASRVVKFDHLLKTIGRSTDTKLRKELLEEFSEFVAARVIETPLVEGAESLMSWLHGQVPLYLASVTPENELEMILQSRGLNAFFRGTYGCPPWTKPNAIRDVLLKESIDPHMAVLLGDSAGDQRAAIETGVQFLARDSGLAFDSPQPPLFPDLHSVKRFIEKTQ